MIHKIFKPATWYGTTAADDQGQVGISIETAGTVHRFLLNAESAHHLSSTLNAQAKRHAPGQCVLPVEDELIIINAHRAGTDPKSINALIFALLQKNGFEIKYQATDETLPSINKEIDHATAYHTDDYSRIDCSAVIVQGKDEQYRLRIHAPGEEGQLGRHLEGYRRGSQNHILDLLRDWMNSKTGNNRPAN